MRKTRSAMITVLLGSSLLLAQPAPPPPPPPAPPAPPEAPAFPGSTRTERRTEALAMGSKLRVVNRNGAIRVMGWEKPEVALVAEIRDTDRRKVDLEVRRAGDGLEIEAIFQKSSWSFGFVTSPRCEMTLQVPRKIVGYFRTTNGNLQVAGLSEPSYAHCETTNGTIRLKDIAGEVRAETTNGSIEAQNLKARIKGNTTNGKITLIDVAGGIRMETTNGGIRAVNLDGWGEGIFLETTNGRIEVELGKAGGELEAANSNGSLEVRVPTAQTIETSKHRAKVKIPGSSQKIRLQTTNGSITVK